MSKVKTVFVCNNCGYESAKWLGKCPSCNEWSTFYEEKLVKDKTNNCLEKPKNVTPRKLNEIEEKSTERKKTGFRELDLVLGGGLVKGSLILLGGEPRNRKIYINSSNLR